jgi:transcription elongation factor Elf1
MVHYLVPQRAGETAPTCPKCGGHRTEAAGRSPNGRGVDLRCHDCDERFVMLVDRRASDADNMTDEVDAIRTVGRALARLRDDASRVRVLRWAAERFQIEAALAPAVAPTAAAAVTTATDEGPDLTLSMDGLSDLFPARKEQDRTQEFDPDLLTFPVARPAVVDQIAELDTIDSIDSLDVVPVAAKPVDDKPIEEKPADAAPQSGSVLHNFVHDFQRLANDCQTLFAE